jgi:hypothetical protein
MPEEKASREGSGIGWWLLVAGLILGCIGLYLVYAPRARPVIHPAVSETGA